MADFEDKRISDLERLTGDLTPQSLFETSYNDSQMAEDEFTTRAATVEQVGRTIVNDIEYASELDTVAKTIIDAINEVNEKAGHGGGGSTVTIADNPEGGIDITVDGDTYTVLKKNENIELKRESEVNRVDNFITPEGVSVVRFDGDVGKEALALSTGEDWGLIQVSAWGDGEDKSAVLGSELTGSYLTMDDVTIKASQLSEVLTHEQRIEALEQGGGGGGSTVSMSDNPDGGVDLTVDGTTKTLAKEEELATIKADLSELNEVKADKTELVPLADRIDVLEKMSKGILYDFVTQTVEGTQNIPKGSHLADVQKLEGKSIVWNQLLNNSKYPTSPVVSSGVTFNFNKEKGTIEAKGTSSGYSYAYIPNVNTVISIIKDHIYYFGSTNFKGNLNLVYEYLSTASENIPTVRVKCTETRNIRCFISVGTYGSSDEIETDSFITPFIIDLTMMFGSGNEPTLEECKALFTEDYYPYNIGELQSVDLTKMTIRGKNLCDLSKFEYVQKWVNNVNAYMYKLKVRPNVKYTLSSNVPYDINTNLYFDGTSTTYAGVWLDTPKSTRADAYGNLYIAIVKGRTYTSDLINGNYWIQLEEGEVATDYSPYSETDYPLAFVGKSAGTVRDELDLVNKKYIQRIGSVDLDSLSWVDTGTTSSSGGKVYANNLSGKANGTINLVSDKFLLHDTSAATMDLNTTRGNATNSYVYVCVSDKSDIVGTMYYELATPIVTDVSDVIDSFEVEGNGTIEFDSSIPVKNTIEYLRYLNEV